MRDYHGFRFDEDKAYQDQLIGALQASPEHPLTQAKAPRLPGVYVIFRSGAPVYVGRAKDLRSRLRDYLKRGSKLKGIDTQKVTCRFLMIERTCARSRWSETRTIHRLDPDSADEERFVAVGMGSAGHVLVVVYTLRGEDIRLISARRATRREVTNYEG